MHLPEEPRIAVVGLGYVGMPLAVEFAKVYPTVGFDINHQRVAQLRDGLDSTGEVSSKELAVCEAAFTTDPSALEECNTYIVTVPTPIDDNNVPLLAPLESASEIVGGSLHEGDVVVHSAQGFVDHCVLGATA